MRIHVRTLTNKTFTLDVPGGGDVNDVMYAIKAHQNIVPDQQRVVFRGSQLDAGRTLASYDIKDGDTMHLVLRLRGNGDMVDNKIITTFPPQGSTGIPPTTTISAQLRPVPKVEPGLLFQVEYMSDREPGYKRVLGTTSYDQATRTASFMPQTRLPADTRFRVWVLGRAVGCYGDFVFVFKTGPDEPIRLRLQLQPSEVVDAVLSEFTLLALLRLCGETFRCQPADIARVACVVRPGFEVEINDDADVAALRNGDMLEVKPRERPGLPLALPPLQDGDAAAGKAHSNECIICFDAPRNVVFTPCGHLACCGKCAAALEHRLCPVCRAPVEKIINVFHA